jgi:hypothetical protein
MHASINYHILRSPHFADVEIKFAEPTSSKELSEASVIGHINIVIQNIVAFLSPANRIKVERVNRQWQIVLREDFSDEKEWGYRLWQASQEHSQYCTVIKQYKEKIKEKELEVASSLWQRAMIFFDRPNNLDTEIRLYYTELNACRKLRNNLEAESLHLGLKNTFEKFQIKKHAIKKLKKELFETEEYFNQIPALPRRDSLLLNRSQKFDLTIMDQAFIGIWRDYSYPAERMEHSVMRASTSLGEMICLKVENIETKKIQTLGFDLNTLVT